MALRTLVVSICLSFAGIAPSLAQAAIKHDIDIPEQRLGPALAELANQTKIQVIYAADLVEGKDAPPVIGSMTPEEALRTMLAKTGLEYAFVDAKTVTLSQEQSASNESRDPSLQVEDSHGGAQKSSFWDRFRLAQVDQGSAPPPAQVVPSRSALDEVVVTAQKRAERLQDVPVPVTAISAANLAETDQVRLQDYYTKIPGLMVTPDSFGAPQVTIRGLTSSNQVNPTVGITIDDVPFGSSSVIAAGWSAPDIDPSDLARVEVLRGPQGTLYGANSLGGLLKFVLLDPSTDGVSGHIQAGTSTVRNGDGLGYQVRGSVNVPITDTFAIRASGFVREDPGYVDNVLTGDKGVNRASGEGGLFSALWRPSADLSLKLTALLQHNATDGSSIIQPSLGDLKQNLAEGTGGSSRTTQLYSATLTAKLGAIDLTSVTGVGRFRFAKSLDFSTLLGGQGGIIDTGGSGYGGYVFPGFGVTGVEAFGRGVTSKFTQEIRLSSSIGEHVDWLLGGFYNHENSSPDFVDLYGIVPETGHVVGSFAHLSYPSTYTDIAGFGDLTFRLNERFDIQLGARENENRQSYSELDSGPQVPLFENSPSPFYYPTVHSKDHSFTYLVTPRFRISPEYMIYARVASGYRAGGPNITSGNYALAALAPVYKPDKTRNYEVGFKSDMFDHNLSLDASIYRIDWDDIQLVALNPNSGLQYYVNGSKAKSQGVELSAQARPTRGLTLSAWVAWNDAQLTKDLPLGSAVVGASGDRLPYGARFSGNVSIEDRISLTSHLVGSVGGSLSYIGDRKGDFASVYLPAPDRVNLPAYAKLDLHAALTHDSWTISLFGNNIAGRRAVLDGGADIFAPANGYFYIQPRTFGLSISKDF